MILSKIQLNSATNCYLQIRAAVNAAGVVPGPFTNATLCALVGNPFINVTLAQTRKLTAIDVWDLMWPLPFYTWMKASFATKRIIHAQNSGWFNNFSNFVGANANQRHPWNVNTLPGSRVYTAIGADACAFCNKTGHYATMPYRTAAKVIYRINNLADCIDALNCKAFIHGCSILDELAGGSVAAPGALSIAFNNLLPKIGGATAFHILSDLGFPCVKPDIWITRIAEWCGWVPGYPAKTLSRNPGWWVLQDVIQQISQHAVANFGVSDPNPIRALDWYVANYGMHFSPKYCPCTGPGVIVPESKQSQTDY